MHPGPIVIYKIEIKWSELKSHLVGGLGPGIEPGIYHLIVTKNLNDKNTYPKWFSISALASNMAVGLAMFLPAIDNPVFLVPYNKHNMCLVQVV